MRKTAIGRDSVPHGCPCGYLSDSRHECRCSATQIQRYRSRISGPLLDRIDIHVEVPAVTYRELHSKATAEPSAAIKPRVTAARKRQTDRFRRAHIHTNAQMNSRQLRKYADVGADCHRLLEAAVGRLGLSARAYNRILKIARTLADLEAVEEISAEHVAEAIQYRSLDRREPAG